MDELYNILSIFVAGSIMFVCGLMFLFTTIPASPLLGNYRKARYVMACAYMLYAAVVVMEYLFQAESPYTNEIDIVQTFTLVVAVSQAFMFFLVFLALLEVRFLRWRHIFREVIYVILLIAAIFMTYVFCSGKTFRIIHYVLSAIYALLLVRYTFMFIRSYQQFRLRMDNYFSDMEAVRLRWVVFSFFSSLAIGIMALLSSLFMSTLVFILFAVVFDAFYLFFAIRFINYAYQFQSIECAMNAEIQSVETIVMPAEIEVENKITRVWNDTFALLEKQVDEWVVGKGFTKQGITIDVLASQFGSNSKYISVYINTYKQQTFRDWINELRIGEAKILLLQHPEMTVNEVAYRIGFSDKSHFLKQFKKQTKVSTSDWKKLAKTQDFPISTPKQS